MSLTLILIGGPSGVGKSRLSQALALRTQSAVAQIDDMQTAIQALVPEDRLPEYFGPATTYLRTSAAEEIVVGLEQVSAFFGPAILAAVENRFESGTSTVFEGDFIAVETAIQARELGAKALFLIATESEIRANFLARDGEAQAGRARVAFLHGQSLAARCAEAGIPAIEASPYETLLARALAALD